LLSGAGHAIIFKELNIRPDPKRTAQSRMFKALSHPVRLQIACALRDGEACVCHLKTLLGRRQAYISQHQMVLRRARILTERRQGAYVFYRLAPGPAARVLLALEQPASRAR